MKIAVSQFSLRPVAHPAAFWARFDELCDKARAQGADLIVFPEYFSLSLMVAENSSKSFHANLHDSRAHSENLLREAEKRAPRHGLSILLGTLPWPESGRLLNRSWMVFRDGRTSLWQDKIYMTRFESEEWKVSGGEKTVKSFDLDGFRAAILTCYDSEFASLSQVVGREGTELLLVPSCTDTQHGYWRVRHCCEARAVENQMFVAMSSIVEGDPRFAEIDAHHGQAAVFGPCDTGFPPDGLLTLGQENREGLTVIGLDKSALENVRKNGSVLNLKDQR